ncbi:DUF1203 domain-containing protein [Streptomyces sp. NPDC002054]|uniref:DUF1203 domain-containing protein n=1 Tax=Streptomyces sp. NPDC002054 TaxID=3154663 RepID=UPI00332EDAA4
MTTYIPLAVTPAGLAALRDRDDAGRPCRPYTDEEGGAPLRCCLRPSVPGDRIALVAYAPLRRWAAGTGVDPGAYDEQGPVFIHAADCGGPDPDPDAPDRAGWPFAHPGGQRIARRYSADGRILGGRVLDLGTEPGKVIDAALDEAFADPEVALVHLRAAEFGCFLFEVRRP